MSCFLLGIACNYDKLGFYFLLVTLLLFLISGDFFFFFVGMGSVQ